MVLWLAPVERFAWGLCQQDRSPRACTGVVDTRDTAAVHSPGRPRACTASPGARSRTGGSAASACAQK